MATSGTYTETRTTTQLVTAAHRVIGVIDPDESLSANQLSNGIQALNDIIYELKGPPNHLLQNRKAWQLETVSLTLVADQSTYNLKPSGGAAAVQVPEEIIAITLKNTADGNEVLLTPMTDMEYQNISNKTSDVKPSHYYYEKRIDTGKLYFNGEIDSDVASAYTAEIKYRQPLENVTDGDHELDVPNYMYRLLKFRLGKDLSTEFDVDDATFRKVQILEAEALAIAKTHEPLENPTDFFEPDKY